MIVSDCMSSPAVIFGPNPTHLLFWLWERAEDRPLGLFLYAGAIPAWFGVLGLGGGLLLRWLDPACCDLTPLHIRLLAAIRALRAEGARRVRARDVAARVDADPAAVGDALDDLHAHQMVRYSWWRGYRTPS
jgi:hypothetical protein